MADGYPKDYSGIYSEDSIKPPPIPAMRRTSAKMPIWSDGARTSRRFTESGVDLRAVVEKLQQLPKENQNAHAIDTLNKHYSSVFKKSAFKVYIQYTEDKETYVVRADNNTLRALMDKTPRKGRYRYFFKQHDNSYEETENLDKPIPYHEINGTKQIYCHVFSMQTYKN